MNDYYFEIWASGIPGYWFYGSFRVIRAENGVIAEEMARAHCESMQSESCKYEPRNLRIL